MGKTAIRIVGSVLLLWGLVEIIDFLWTGDPPAGPVEMNVSEYDIGGFVFVLVLLITGLNIIQLKNSGRIWGLIILWLTFLPSLAGLIVSLVYAINPDIADSFTLIGSISFRGTQYGLSQDYTITGPWPLFACFVLLTLFIGVQIYILSSKKNRVYFTAQNATGS